MDKRSDSIQQESREFWQSLNITDRCSAGAPPPCAEACPYGLNVREFLKKLRRGSFRAAYNFLRDSLIFPKTLCALCGAACVSACALHTAGVGIDLPGIEKSVFAHVGERPTASFDFSQKKEKVAVIGGGLLGLSCAYILAVSGYTVSVFEASMRIGGRVGTVLREEQYLPELMDIFGIEGLTLHTSSRIHAFSELLEYDAVFAAVDAGPLLANEPDGQLPEGYFFYKDNICDISIADAMSSGRAAAQTISAFLKTGRRPPDIASPTRSAAADPFPEKRDGSAGILSKDEAVAEARRCVLCDCRACQNACGMLRHFQTMPNKVLSDVRVTLNPVSGLMARRATRLICSCDDCGQCEEACPENIGLGRMLMSTRSVMARDNSIPPAFHDFWMRDMSFACSEKASYLLAADNGYLLFPGCQLGASNPKYVLTAHKLLNEALPGSGLLLSCCGVPAKWAGDGEAFNARLAELRGIWAECGRPCFVTACPTCRRTFNEFLPEIVTVSLYTVLAGYPQLSLPAEKRPPRRAAIFHPCSSRRDAQEQESVRRLLERCGVQTEEIEDETDRNGCCGFGGHIYPANTELFDETVRRRTNASPLPYITYCANCRDIFAADGKACVHVLDVLAGETEGGRQPPDLERRRSNRSALKASLSGDTSETEEQMELLISDELSRELNRQLILDSDIRAVISHCIAEQCFLLTEDETCIGHLRQGTITCWVMWREHEGRIHILNAYSHRMVIEGE